MCIRRLKREAPDAALTIRNEVMCALACASTRLITFKALMETVDTSGLPERPDDSRWSANPFAASVVVMETLQALITEGVVAELVGDRLVYRLSTPMCDTYCGGPSNA